MDEQDNSFAGVPWPGEGVGMHREVARRRLLLVRSEWLSEIGATEGELERFNPYVWQYGLAADRYLANIGEWVCQRFARGRAEYAGAALRNQRRRFAIHLWNGYQSTTEGVTTRPLQRELSRCGVHPRPVSVSSAGLTSSQADALILKMQEQGEHGVTTVICLCDSGAEVALTQAATRHDYVPEWITTFHSNAHVPLWIQRPQTEHRLGLSNNPMLLPLQDEPAWRAVRDADPHHSEPGAHGYSWPFLLRLYRQLLLLASGIQMAGPNLTPRTFAAGLHRTKFPNPQDPRMPGKVGFTDGGHAMVKDAAQVYFDRDTPGHYAGEQGGSTCYLQRGARYSLGRWGKATGRFYGTCFNGRLGRR